MHLSFGGMLDSVPFAEPLVDEVIYGNNSDDYRSYILGENSELAQIAEHHNFLDIAYEAEEWLYNSGELAGMLAQSGLLSGASIPIKANWSMLSQKPGEQLIKEFVLGDVAYYGLNVGEDYYWDNIDQGL